MTSRYVCVHGHFYQPPRENPWLETIEVQDSAHPYHDWNERIAAECYAPNAASRILDDDQRIGAIVSNYERISFDFGPTLLSWLETNASEVYAAVIAADAASAAAFSGHGSALAHAYNHVILPLANARDRRTQIVWGIADFRRRFGREPEGMWLPETALDLPTLEALADAGIRYTVLAPRQAARVRSGKGARWRDVAGDDVDPTVAYKLALPSGRGVAVFFYDGPISRDVAFGGLLHSGAQFAARLLAQARAGGDAPRLVHAATDGETFGHHHAHGDMALAFALRAVGAASDVRLTNYGEFLERHPPSAEVEIREKTSWSCAHGVERWRSDCGCATGSHPDWNQAWRGPLRDALDGLRDAVAGPFAARGASLLRDPWAAREAYVGVVLDRSPANVDRFLAAHAVRPLAEADRVAALELLELQRHAMLMYTSCGWFFDDLAGIEGLQVLQYAGRVVQLAEKLFDAPFEGQFLDALAKARSNRPAEGDGRRVYLRHVRPAMVELPDVGGHYAVRSLFEAYGPEARVGCYRIAREDFREASGPAGTLAIGRAAIVSEITAETGRFAFGALHLGDHNVRGGVRKPPAEDAYEQVASELSHAFSRADVPELLRLVEIGFPDRLVSLKDLFRDDQRRILRRILTRRREEAEAELRRIYERNLPLIRFLGDLGAHRPRVFRAIGDFVVNAGLRRALEATPFDPTAVARLLEEAAFEKVSLEGDALAYEMRRRLEELAGALAANPEDPARLSALLDAVQVARRMPFRVDLWRVQNVCWRLLETGRIARGEEAETLARLLDLGAAVFAERPTAQPAV